MTLGAVNRRRATVSGLLLLLTCPLTVKDGTAQSVGGFLTEEGSERSIRNASVTLSDSAGSTVAGTLTNWNGHFTLDAPGPGFYSLSAAAIGYGRGSNGPFELSDGSHLEIEFRLRLSPITLPGIRIEVERARTDKFITTQGFYQRQKRGSGYFFSPERIEKIDPIDYQDLLNRVPGVRYVDAGWGGSNIVCASSSRSLANPGDEAPRVYLDGMPVSSQNLHTLARIGDIAAVEVYRGGASIPVEFPATGSSCLELVWTKG